MAQDQNLAAVWADSDSAATVLIASGLSRFGLDCLNWHPQTWHYEIEEESGLVPHPRNLDRVLAACCLKLRPDEFYQLEAGFHDLAEGLAAESFNPSTWHPLTALECAWAILEAYLIEPPDSPAEGFSPAVIRYVNLTVRRDGYPHLPKVFTAFGIPVDATLPPPADYSADPDLFLAAQSGTEGAESDLTSDLAAHLENLVAGLKTLHFHQGPGAAVVEEIRQRVAALRRVPALKIGHH